MDREECVYNLIPKKEAKIEKPPRYVSKYSAQVNQERHMHKSSHKTMGPAKVEAPSTAMFLRKQSKASKVSDSIKPFKEGNFKRTPVLTRSDDSWMDPQTKKDFIKSNTNKVINSEARKPQAASVFTNNWDVQLLENSEILPKIVDKKGSDSIKPFKEGNFKRTPVLTRSDDSWMDPQTNKDFIKSNTNKVINSEARKPQAASVFTNNWDVQLLENSEILPKIVDKKGSDLITAFKEENLKKMPMLTRSDNSWMCPQTKKEFIKSDAIHVIDSQPRKPQAASVFTKNGDVQLLENSGILPKIVDKKGSDSIKPFKEENFKRTPVLTRSDDSWMDPQTNKDFIKSNTNKVINSEARKPQAASVFTNNWDVQLLENSEILPKIVDKKGSDSIKPFKEENFERTPVLTRSDNSWMRPQTKKDFIKSNAINVINSQPRRPQAASVFTKNGDVKLLENSGILPKIVNKNVCDYGQIPEYLKLRKEKEREQKEYEKQERLRQEGLQVKLEEERLSVLQGLKKNLEELLLEYRRLPIVIETIRMRNYKQNLESQIRQLDKDIDLMERPKRIYIGNN